MSDYIERLRGELLRAEATKRRRVSAPPLRPVLVLATIVAALAVTVALFPRADEREVPAGSATSTYTVDGDADGTARVLRERFTAAGIDGATVDVSGKTLTITAPGDIRPLLRRGMLNVYDWERSLRGGDEPVSQREAEARDGLAVRAEDGSGWLTLGGRAALDSAAVGSAKAATDPANGRPIVLIQLRPTGQRAFHDLTRELALRGMNTTSMEDLQHLAIVVDDQVYSVPFIDGRYAPDGIDGREGLHISHDFTARQAKELAAVINSGVLPGTLSPS